MSGLQHQAVRETMIPTLYGDSIEPIRVISGRCDVSEEVIEKHYDERNPDEKRELRQKVMEKIRAENEQEGYQ